MDSGTPKATPGRLAYPETEIAAVQIGSDCTNHERKVRCESPKGQIVNRPPSWFFTLQHGHERQRRGLGNAIRACPLAGWRIRLLDKAALNPYAVLANRVSAVPDPAFAPKRERSAGAGSTDGLHTRATRHSASRSAVESASHPFPWLDHPPRGCRVPRPEARKPGYSYPSGGRDRALQAILRPWIPPNRPQATQNGCERGSSAGRVGMARMANTQSARGPPTGGSSSPRRSRPSYPAGPVRQGSRPAGPSAMTGQRSVAATATGLGGWSAPCPPRLRQAGIGGGQRGHSPPPASAGRRTECGPKEYAGLSPIACVKPAPAGALESARNRCRADARRRQWPLGRRPGTRLRA